MRHCRGTSLKPGENINMNKLQISSKLKGILGRFEYIKLPDILPQGELLKVKCDIEELERKIFKEYLEETK